jgi:hypothetical protein
MTSDGRTIDDVRILLVVGPMRTGTTLVAQLLGSHPDVHYLGFELAEQWADWTGLPWGAPGAGHITGPPLDTEDATPERVAAVRTGLGRLLADRTGTASAASMSASKNAPGRRSVDVGPTHGAAPLASL